MKYVMVAPVGEHMNELYVGIRDFPTEKVILISPKDKIELAESTKKELARFQIPVKIIEIKGNLWEEVFKTIAEIKNAEKGKEIIICVSTSERDTRCAATSAAFVNGIKAFGVDGTSVMLLPVLKFNYYRMLTDKKLEILKLLNQPGCCSSLDEVSQKTKMSLPLVSYHINGTLKSEGLKQLGLVETNEHRGKINVSLTSLGKMLVKGYITS